MDDAVAKMLEVLQSLAEKLDKIHSKLAEIVEGQKELIERLGRSVEEEGLKALDVLSLLELPDHLRKTAMALSKIGEGTASEVAGLTGRERAIESSYLNQLVRMGYVKKRRAGRKVVFSAR
ncbi:MAG: transcriptional regulator [Candidatus Nezhaarchaeota archaeon]|nr:transcriptional regulator [Candidatus Nezhaarchaeota archaeon]